MDVAAPALILLAKLILMGPGETRTLSEHRAKVPPGATGMIQERLDQPDLPRAVRIYLAPAASPPAPAGEEPLPVKVAIRAELWSDPAGAAAGRPPDEVNLEEIVVSPAGAAFVQIAEGGDPEQRLVLTVATLTEEAAAPALPGAPAKPARQVAFRIEAFRDKEGTRELIVQQVLLTLEGRPVTWETTLRRSLSPRSEGSRSLEREEGVKLTLLPGAFSAGWISVEARLEARVLAAAPESGVTVPLGSSVSRTVPIGIPFAISVEAPIGQPGASAPPPPPEAYIVEVTPFLPPAP